jgi:aquaporin Z
VSIGAVLRDHRLTLSIDAEPPMNSDSDHDLSPEIDTDPVPALVPSPRRPLPAQLGERAPVLDRDFTDLSYEWRRLFSELFGTFLLVIAAAGGGVIQHRSGGQIGRVAEVTAPALTVLTVILFMGAVSGAHLNPIVSVAFALRRDFQWRRVPGYILAQLLGAVLAALLLWAAPRFSALPS